LLKDEAQFQTIVFAKTIIDFLNDLFAKTIIEFLNDFFSSAEEVLSLQSEINELKVGKKSCLS